MLGDWWGGTRVGEVVLGAAICGLGPGGGENRPGPQLSGDLLQVRVHLLPCLEVILCHLNGSTWAYFLVDLGRWIEDRKKDRIYAALLPLILSPSWP